MSIIDGRRNTETLTARLDRNYIPVTESGCWIWTASVTPKGYGQLTHNRKHYEAHRASWMAFRGDPAGKHVLHRCNVSMCINPDHLYLGGDWENARDRIAAGTQAIPPRMLGEQHHQARLTESDVRKIRASKSKLAVIAKEFGIAACTASAIRTKRLWRHVI